MTVGRFIHNLLFPPRCIACGRFLQSSLLDPCKDPLCDRCRVDWEREKTENCPRCGSELLLCRCSSDGMEAVGIGRSIKLVYYRRFRDSAGRRIVLYLKTHRNRRAFRFLAGQLAFPLRKYMEERALLPTDVCLCYVPRSYKSEDAYGVDQAKLLCREIGKCLGISISPLFFRTSGGGKEQKNLSAAERKQNAKKQFAINKSMAEKTLRNVREVWLVDDVVTTGASMMACVGCMRPFYKGDVLAISLARAPLIRKKSPEKID